MAVTWYSADRGDYVMEMTEVINDALDADLGPLTAGVLSIALVNPGNWNPDFAEPTLREAFMESNANTELADTVISTLLKHHELLLSLAA